MNPDQAEPDGMQVPPPSSSRTRADAGTRAFPSGIIPTEVLFQGNQEILISHNGEHYRLRITRNGKLILTK
jgi:hemin uptake protein HemP